MSYMYVCMYIILCVFYLNKYQLIWSSGLQIRKRFIYFFLFHLEKTDDNKHSLVISIDRSDDWRTIKAFLKLHLRMQKRLWKLMTTENS